MQFSYLPSFFVIVAELYPNRTITSRVIDFLHSVSLIAQMPGNVALDESHKCSFHLRIPVFKNEYKLLTRVNGVTGELIKSLVQIDFSDMAIVVEQAGLVPWIVELFVEGQHVVHENYPLVHLSER